MGPTIRSKAALSSADSFRYMCDACCPTGRGREGPHSHSRDVGHGYLQQLVDDNIVLLRCADVVPLWTETGRPEESLVSPLGRPVSKPPTARAYLCEGLEIRPFQLYQVLPVHGFEIPCSRGLWEQAGRRRETEGSWVTVVAVTRWRQCHRRVSAYQRATRAWHEACLCGRAATFCDPP